MHTHTHTHLRVNVCAHTHTHTHSLSLHPHHLLPSVQRTLEIALSGPTWMATTAKWLYRPLCTPSLSPSLATTSTGQTGRCVSGLESAEVYLIHLSWQSAEIAFNNNSTKCVKSTCTQVHTWMHASESVDTCTLLVSLYHFLLPCLSLCCHLRVNWQVFLIAECCVKPRWSDRDAHGNKPEDVFASWMLCAGKQMEVHTLPDRCTWE